MNGNPGARIPQPALPQLQSAHQHAGAGQSESPSGCLPCPLPLASREQPPSLFPSPSPLLPSSTSVGKPCRGSCPGPHARHKTECLLCTRARLPAETATVRQISLTSTKSSMTANVTPWYSQRRWSMRSPEPLLRGTQDIECWESIPTGRDNSEIPERRAQWFGGGGCRPPKRMSGNCSLVMTALYGRQMWQLEVSNLMVGDSGEQG